jgi:hypothetical protein
MPKIFLNVEDYIFYNAGDQINTRFKAVMAYLRSSDACGNTGLESAGGRLHWGKAGNDCAWLGPLRWYRR